MLRQLLISVLVIAAAGAGYVFFVPGAAENLERFGITLPAEAAPSPETTTPGGPRQAGERQGGQQANRGGRRGGARDLVVVTAPVLMGSINDSLTAIGEGEAAHSVTVMSPSTGTLDELSVRPGDVVKAGDVIGHLDADAEQIAFERANLAMQDAEAALTRTQELADANSATTVQLNTARLAADNARLELRNAELELNRRTITSPIGGTVGLFQVNPGNNVNAQSIVTTIEDTSHIVISFWVPERYASSIQTGMPVEAIAVALPGETLTGEVTAVDNRVDPASRTLEVQAQIANANGKLRPGMSFSVAMSFPGEQFPSVDPLAIQWSSDGAYVWSYADGKVDRLPVQIIQRDSDGVLVKGDLGEGAQVVTQGVQQLTAGASVRLLQDMLAGDTRQAENEGNGPQGQS